MPSESRDDMKDDEIKYYATAKLQVIRLLLAVASFIQMCFGVVYIRGAYMKIGPIKRYM